MTRLSRTAAAIALLASVICTQESPASAASVTFASSVQGRKILTTSDEFVQRLSPFDRSARLKTSDDVSEAKYLAFVGAQVREWTETERAVLQSILSDIYPAMDVLSVPWPNTIYLIKPLEMRRETPLIRELMRLWCLLLNWKKALSFCDLLLPTNSSIFLAGRIPR
jgi:hypothetical protein